MAVLEKKITNYPPLTTSPLPEDLFVVVHDPNNVPSTRIVTYETFFKDVSVNVTFSNTVFFNSNVEANSIYTKTLTITTPTTPGTSTDAYQQGTIMYDTNYLYITVANNVIKRLPLNSF